MASTNVGLPEARWSWRLRSASAEGAPVRFTPGPDGPERVSVSLPTDPLAAPRGDR